jgi:hypothetical protein
MATRSIVTSHPDIACEVCGRRLLRGEHPDVFLSGGQRRMVCELCAPRAAHEGWLRESDEDRMSSRPAERARRSRSLLARLRQPVAGNPGVGSPAADNPEVGGPVGGHPVASAPHRTHRPVAALPHEPTPLPTVSAADEESELQRAVDLFNVGEYPRRVAGVTRSLGTPSIRIASATPTGGLVDLVVAWELCWYRYRVDLDDEQAGVQLIAEGTELAELPTQDRVANAIADERGELSLTA